MKSNPMRECPECGMDRVVSHREADRVFRSLEDHAERAIERAKSHPQTDLLCTNCWTEVIQPRTYPADETTDQYDDPDEVTSS